jgi:hypothetical protein
MRSVGGTYMVQRKMGCAAFTSARFLFLKKKRKMTKHTMKPSPAIVMVMMPFRLPYGMYLRAELASQK